MSQIRLRRLFVDAKLQGALLAHVALYWLYCWLLVAMIALIWIVFGKRPPTSADLFREIWVNFSPAFIGAFLLLPLVLLDCLRISNRFAGPMLRLRREMQALADGEVACPVQLRDEDFWVDFAEDWNRVLASQKSGGDGALTAQLPQPADIERRPIAASRIPAPNSTRSNFTDTISA